MGHVTLDTDCLTVWLTSRVKAVNCPWTTMANQLTHVWQSTLLHPDCTSQNTNKQRLHSIPSFWTGMHADCETCMVFFFFYLTLAFVEPQHTASEHRHGRGHGGGVKGGGFMDCGCWPPRSRLNDGCSWWSVKLFSVANSFFPFFFLADGQMVQRWRKGKRG